MIVKCAGFWMMTLTAVAALAAPVAAEEIWTPNPLVTIYEGVDYSAKDDPKCAIRLASARNGAVSGQVVVSSKTPIKGPEAKMGDLKLKDGKAVIPASAVEVHYALPTGVNGLSKLPAGCTAIFDALAPKPRETGSVHPVWITVNVPADAAPGEYEGALAVAGRAVPVRLFVSGWTMPAPADFTTWADFIESPESVARRYEVPLWSDRHYELMASCFRQLGKVGNKTLYLDLAGMTNMGNEQTIVRWIGTSSTGSGQADKERVYKHDFVPAEKYMDACIKNAGKPRVVIFHVYENFLGGSQGGKKEEWERGIQFTLLDPATGKTELKEGPTLNNANPQGPNYPDDTIAFLKPVCDGLRDRLKERGVGEETIAFGISVDMPPGKATAETLLKAAPYGHWASHAHGLRIGLYVIHGGYCTTVWNARFAEPAKGRTYGWQNKDQVLMNDRDIWKPDFPRQLVRSRLLGEMNITGKQRGFGRMSADFWPCIKNDKGQWASGLANRFPLSNWAQLNLRQTPYLYPGPDGALSTVRFEMLREGIEECEARIFIEKALLDKAASARLGDELAKRAQDLLDERVRTLLAATSKSGKPSSIGIMETSAEFADTNWQDSSQKLFALAGEVALRLGSGQAEALGVKQ